MRVDTLTTTMRTRRGNRTGRRPQISFINNEINLFAPRAMISEWHVRASWVEFEMSSEWPWRMGWVGGWWWVDVVAGGTLVSCSYSFYKYVTCACSIAPLFYALVWLCWYRIQIAIAWSIKRVYFEYAISRIILWFCGIVKMSDIYILLLDYMGRGIAHMTHTQTLIPPGAISIPFCNVENISPIGCWHVHTV